MRRLVVTASLLGCSTTVDTAGPSEEGMYSDEAPGDDIEGVLVRCGNELDANYYWHQQDTGPSQVYVMPVICVGSTDTPGFDLEDAEPRDDGFDFPVWDEPIQLQCVDACLAAHDPSTEQTPVCDQAAFTPNITINDWQPDDGPNCDSTVLPNIVKWRPFDIEGTRP